MILYSFISPTLQINALIITKLMASIFSKIIKGDIPSYKIWEDDRYYAFLDINPLAEGHTLLVPKREVDDMFDLEDDELMGLHLASKRIAKALRQAVPCRRIGTAVVGFEVPHAHLHIVPLNQISDLDFGKPKLDFTKEAFEATAAKIRSLLAG